MRVIIAGPGAVGLFLAARLATAADVLLLHHDAEAAEELEREGFELAALDGDKARFHLPCTVSPPPEADLAVVAVKSYDLSRAASVLAGTAVRAVLGVQNGIGNCERLEAVFGGERVYAGVLTYGLYRPSKRRVVTAGEGELAVGPWKGGAEGAVLVGLLGRAGVNARLSSDIGREIWLKAGVNACINPPAALFGVRNGELLRIPGIALMWEDIAAETARAAAYAGTRLTAGEILEKARRVAEATAANKCSMLQDIEAGRPTEAEAILGGIVERCEAGGGEAPACRELLEKIRELEGNAGKERSRS